MRCPKCGYNSFDYLDNCKKCGKDLLEFKQRYGLKSLLLPGAILAAASFGKHEEFSETEAAELTGAVSAGAASGVGVTAAGVAAAGTAATNEPIEEDNDGADFGFDFMGDSNDDGDDLSFDELFDGTPDEDDVEEALEAPKSSPGTTTTATASASESMSDDEFAFELPDLEGDQDDELEDDFGFDPANIDFDTINDDESINEQEKPKGSGEGSQSPFDLPESSPFVGTPEIQTATIATPSVNSGLTQPQIAGSDDVFTEPDEVPAQNSVTPVIAAQANIRSAGSPFVSQPANEIVLNEPAYASLGSCFMAFSYDLIVLMVMGLCFLVAGEMAMSGSSGVLPTVDTLIRLSIPYFLVLFSLSFGYFTLFHFLTGQTPGKMLIGLRVETITGESVPFTQAFLRSVGGLLLALPLGAGYLMMLVQSDRQGWNDRFAGTRVVYVTDSD